MYVRVAFHCAFRNVTITQISGSAYSPNLQEICLTLSLFCFQWFYLSFLFFLLFSYFFQDLHFVPFLSSICVEKRKIHKKKQNAHIFVTDNIRMFSHFN